MPSFEEPDARIGHIRICGSRGWATTRGHPARIDAASRDAIGLPVEIKGQWHRDVWNAASDQLDANYARDWHAQGRGVYVVLWFGDVPGKQLPGHPDARERPLTPETLREMLNDRLPEARRFWIDIFVMDVSTPAGDT